MENPFDALNKSIHQQSQQITKKEYLTALCFQGLMNRETTLNYVNIVKLSLDAAKEIIKQCQKDN